MIFARDRMCRSRLSEKEMKQSNEFPPGWDEEQVLRVVRHYEAQSDEEAVDEDEAAFENAELNSASPASSGMNPRATGQRRMNPASEGALSKRSRL